MKINHPNVDAEILIPDDAVLVSRTDTHGIITYVNSYFAEISGYAFSELLGKSHNVVRHSDVPPAVFKDLWETLKRGECWRGVVKNRAKSGRYYWVDACVTPIFEDRKIVGYSSIRRRASREQIAAAGKLFDSVNRGGKLKAWWQSRWVNKLVSIRTGVTVGIVTAIGACLAGAAYSVIKIEQHTDEADRFYQATAAATGSLNRIKFLMAENRTQLLMALLHNPSMPSVVQHLDHPIAAHLATVAANRVEIERLWTVFAALPIEASVHKTAEIYWQSRLRYVGEGLAPIQQALSARADFLQASRLLAGPLAETYRLANASIDQLISELQKSNEAAIQAQNRRHQQDVAAMAWATLAVALFFILGGIWFFRGIMRPLQSSIDNLSAIARGDLSRHPDAIGQGETFALGQAVTITQCNLHTILDEIAQDASVLAGTAARLNIQVRQIADGTDEQHSRVHLMLDKMTASAQAIKDVSIQTETLHGASASMLERLGAAEPGIVGLSEDLNRLAQGLRELAERSASSDAPHGPPPQEIGAFVADMTRFTERLTAFTGADWAGLREGGESIVALSRELAINARLEAFSAEDLQRDIEIVTEYLVDNRQATHAIWAAMHQVLDEAGSLEKLSATFKFAPDPGLRRWCAGGG